MLNYTDRSIAIITAILNDIQPGQTITLLVMDDKLDQHQEIEKHHDKRNATIRVEGPFLKILTRCNNYVITDKFINIKNLRVNEKMLMTSRIPLTNILQIGVGVGASSGCIYSRVARTNEAVRNEKFPNTKAFMESDAAANFPPTTHKCFCDIKLQKLTLRSTEDVMAVVQKFDPEELITIEYEVDDEICANFTVHAKSVRVHGDNIEALAMVVGREDVKVIAPAKILSIRDYSF